jgi:hypothetical protein
MSAESSRVSSLNAAKELDKTPPPASPVDMAHPGDGQVASGPSPAQSESLALMKANSQVKSSPADSATNSLPDAAPNKSEPDQLEITPLKEFPRQAPANEVLGAHEQLIASASRSFNGDASKLAAFENNMNTFEERMKSSSPEDVAQTYGEVKRLLDTSSVIVSDQQRATLASDVMKRAAHPLESNQGNSNDCAAASIENLLYAKSPALAAGYVADVALTGKFTDQQGNVVSVDKETIATQRPEMTDKETKFGFEPRNFGDQVIQASIRNEELALVNARNGISSDGQKGLKYEVRDGDDFVNKTGEQVIDYSENPPKDVTPDWYSGMQGDDIKDVAAALDPKNSKNSDNLLVGAWSVANVEQLKAALANSEPPYPRILGVNLAQKPFSKPEDGAMDAYHAITIESYDPKTNLIHYRNPNYASRDLTTDADTMYNAMLINRGDGQLTDAGNELKQARASIEKHPGVVRDATYQYLQQTEVAQRKEVLQILSKKSGIDLEQLLNDQQKRELGIAP